MSDMVVLRDLVEDDAERIAAMGDSENIYSQMRDAFPHPYTSEKALAYIRGVRGNPKCVCRAILYGGEVVGNIGALRLEDVYRRNAEIAYFIGEEYWGRGIVAEALDKMCAIIFVGYPEISRIFAEPFGTNQRSRRVLEKAGFRFEGIIRGNIFKNGKTDDTYIYGLLREEWEHRRQPLF
jgi:[ribosomal protein S5]-alanine N-acetyltransferase